MIMIDAAIEYICDLFRYDYGGHVTEHTQRVYHNALSRKLKDALNTEAARKLAEDRPLFEEAAKGLADMLKIPVTDMQGSDASPEL